MTSDQMVSRRAPRTLVIGFTTLLAAVLTMGLLPLTSVPALADESVERSAGPERIATAVAASRDHRASAGDALLATAGSFPDALSAGAMAASLDAPMLLTLTDELPDVVAAELRRLGVQTVWILGGTAVIAPAVEEDLAARGYEVRRVAGDNRYETAREIALESGPSASGDVVVALGDHPDTDRAWPDAVASGALAASPDRVPTLLTASDRLPAATEAALSELGAQRVLLIGGETAVGANVEDRLLDLGYAVERIAGSSRYETSVRLAAEALARTPADQQQVVFATGGDFPDALAAGALAGALNSPLVLVPPEALNSTVDGFLRERTERWVGGVVVGGPGAASEFVLAQLTAAINNQPAPEEPPAADERRVTGSFEGEASYYGENFRGRRTASGEPFNPDDLTAAHRSLPFGTIVRVTNLANGRQVEVRINDRGPYAGNRVIDLSKAAAAEIDMISTGTAHVRGEILE
ncbi:MAG: septal ring lytic transglycosylase RlpA family protein [Egibacteraceae bacterium]